MQDDLKERLQYTITYGVFDALGSGQYVTHEELKARIAALEAQLAASDHSVRELQKQAIAAWNNRAALTAIMDAGDGVPSEAAWELADKIVLGNQGVGNAAALIEPALVAAAAAERARSAAKLRSAADQFDKKGWETEWAIADELRELADAIERGEV